ncbi:MAG: ABC transporter permease [Allosphingosinicella sp.]
MVRPALRQLLYAVNLAIGMLLFVCAYSFMGAVAASITEGLESFGNDAIIVSQPDSGFTNSPSARPLDKAAVDRLRLALGDRFDISPVARSVGPVSAGASEDYVSVWRAEPGLLRTAGLRLTGGRNFTAFEAEARADVCLLSDELATGLGRREQVMVEGRLCRVIGTVSSDEVIPDYSTARSVYLPFGWGRQVNPEEKAPVSQVFLRDRSGAPPDGAESAIRAALGPAYAGQAEIWFARDFWRVRTRIADSLWVLVLFMAGVVLGMAALGLANSLSLDVLQRRGEIGLRIALGATRRDIFAMFLMQGLAVVLTGGLIGALTGALLIVHVLDPLVSGSELLGATRLVVDGTTVAAAMLVLAAASAAACLVPARRAMKVDPSLAIRSL